MEADSREQREISIDAFRTGCRIFPVLFGLFLPNHNLPERIVSSVCFQSDLINAGKPDQNVRLPLSRTAEQLIDQYPPDFFPACRKLHPAQFGTRKSIVADSVPCDRFRYGDIFQMRRGKSVIPDRGHGVRNGDSLRVHRSKGKFVDGVNPGRKLQMTVIGKTRVQDPPAYIIIPPPVYCPGRSVKRTYAKAQLFPVLHTVHILVNMAEADTLGDQNPVQQSTVGKGIGVDAAQRLGKTDFFQILTARKSPDPDLIDTLPDHEFPDQFLFVLPGRSRISAAGEIRNLAESRDYEYSVSSQTPDKRLTASEKFTGLDEIRFHLRVCFGFCCHPVHFVISVLHHSNNPPSGIMDPIQ